MDSVNSTQKQTEQMIAFIINEAKEKANEIEAKAMEEFDIQKLKQVQMMKDKIRQEFAKRAQHEEAKRAVARSTAINNSRLLKIQARQRCIEAASDAALVRLGDFTQNKDKYRAVIVDLLVQGALRILEDKIIVRCRECDKSIVSSALSAASSKYTEVLKSNGITGRSVSFTLDDTTYLPPAAPVDPSKGDLKKFLEQERALLNRDPAEVEKERKEKEKEARRAARASKQSAAFCSGGVVLFNSTGRISVDQTLDARLALINEECKPRIRFTLFPGLKPEPASIESIKYREEKRKANQPFVKAMVKGGKFAVKA